MTNPLRTLQEYGQSVWLDFVSRELLKSGGLARLVAEDGIRGVTSNPSIFEKAIGHGDDYDELIAAAQRTGDLDPGALFEQLAIRDIQDGADALSGVYEQTQHRDGYISIEVSPYLALQTGETIEEARRLWRDIGRPNLMVKVPATKPGLPAIRTLIGEGINVNITLLFSQKVYEDVAEAYIAGIEDFIAKGGDPHGVASVASFFVSRIDTMIDEALDKRIAATSDPAEKQRLAALKGRVAIANAKLAYEAYQRIFGDERWRRLAQTGAQTQRLLWASTGTKNPSYSDVLYVEELIGPDTVNTMPPATMDAFRDHGTPRASLEEDVAGARAVMDGLAEAGISIDEITARLVEDGVKLFADAADQLYAAVQKKRRIVLGGRLNPMSYRLPKELDDGVKAALEDWRKEGKVRRLWAGDASLWTGTDEANWLGWLTIVDEQLKRANDLDAFAADIRRGDFSDALLLGMGGSSLGAEVLAESFSGKPGFPRLQIVDSTDPAQIRRIGQSVDLTQTLFIVSSKSGSTLEPNILFEHVFDRVAQAAGPDEAPGRFVAITDPGSALEQLAEARGFRRVFQGRPSIGGRYSALSDFGLAPAAFMGLDVGRLLDRANEMVQSCASCVPARENPGVVLGILLGVLAAHGRDKVTIAASPAVASFGAWLEQLLAESTGKQGRGLIPVDGEELGPSSIYGDDRVFVYLRLEPSADAGQDRAIEALASDGYPVIRIGLADRYDLGQEFFRWQMATAIAGALLGINPFDQPDVEASKIETRRLTTACEKTGALPAETPFLAGDGLAFFADPANAGAIEKAMGGDRSPAGCLHAHLSRLSPGDYFAVLAYVDRCPEYDALLQHIRHGVRERTRAATCVGFGPRFLHSTGQAYKGGPPSGVFLQITCDDAVDLPVPGRKYTFGTVKAAQAQGDLAVLAARGRRAVRVHLGPDVAAGLGTLTRAVDAALAR
jgi:transaldolase / glucose-6-phosphate isomerase